MRLAVVVALAAAAMACDGAQAGPLEREATLLQECSNIYEKLCAEFEPGPEMIGTCIESRPEIAQQVPPKCQPDFQANVENYRDALKNGGR